MDHLMRYARLMVDKEQPFPIDFLNPNYTQYILHMRWYEDTYYNEVTGKNWYGLKHRKETMEIFLKSYGIPTDLWKYRLPSEPKRKNIYVLPPPTVHHMITYEGYSNDDDVNQLFQNILAHDFWIGWRNPSEPCVMTVKNLHDFKLPYITVIEPKKHYTARAVYLEPVILTGKTRKSLKNYVNYIRPKFESQ